MEKAIITTEDSSKSRLQRKAETLLATADVRLGDERPWDLRVHSEEFFRRVFSGGSLALGETYMEGLWDCPWLDEFFFRVMQVRLRKQVNSSADVLFNLFTRLYNTQRAARAFEIGKRHYNIGNDLFRVMLDKHMTYSCGYWQAAETLDEAQEAKLDLICRKLDLAPGMRVLDIGCGWGGAARFAAERYGVEVVGITVATEQAKLAREFCEGFPIEIRVQDYRELNEQFDAIFSVGMFEHVGYKNYREYMKVASRCLKPEGRFLLHTIGGNETVTTTDPWIRRYIFPNSMLPSAQQISAAIEGLFVMEDWHCFGQYYDNTLMQWYDNFKRNWDSLRDQYDDTFYRMWEYYLCSCAGSFRARANQLWQILLSPNGVPGGVIAPR